MTQFFLLTASCAPATAPSPRLLHPTTPQPSQAISTRRGQSQEATVTKPTQHVTASCAPATVPSQSLIPRAPLTQRPPASTRRGRLWGATVTQLSLTVTPSCGA